MRRNAVVLVAVLGCAVAGGCQDPNAGQEPAPTPSAHADTMDVDYYATDSDTALLTQSEAEEIDAPRQQAPPAVRANAVRTHVVAKGDTLTKLAKRYYKDGQKWKDIHAANRDRIADPNSLRVGQKLIIP